MPTIKDLHIVSIRDIQLQEKNFLDLEQLVLECENTYPGIDLWFKKKVIPGLTDKSRRGYIVYEGNTPIAGTVLKFSEQAKLCSLRVRPEYCGMGIGTALFGIIAKEASQISDTIHFTAPEGLIEKEGAFFDKLGFVNYGSVNKKYRNGEEEFYFKGDVSLIRESTEPFLYQTLFGTEIRTEVNGLPWLVMSIHPKYANAIMQGRKTVEIRRRFSPQNIGAHVLIYSTNPDSAVLGSARISNAERLETTMVTSNFLEKTAANKTDLEDYAQGLNYLWAITLEDVQPFDRPYLKSELEKIVGIPIQAPMSYGFARRGTSWGRVTEHLAMTDSLQRKAIK